MQQAVETLAIRITADEQMRDVLHLHIDVPFRADEYADAVANLEGRLLTADHPIDVICTMTHTTDDRLDAAPAVRYDKLLGTISPHIGTIALVSPLTANIFNLARTMFVSAISITGMCDRIHVTASVEEARGLIGYLRQGAKS